jgi:hypothetical protein
MFRFFFALALVLVPTFVSALTEDKAVVVRGVVTQVQPCDSVGYLLTTTLGTTTTTLVVDAGTSVSPLGTAPQLGLSAFTILKGVGLCDTNLGGLSSVVSARRATYVVFSTQSITTTPPRPRTQSGSGQGGSTFMNQIQNVFSQLTQPPKTQPKAGSSGSGGGSGGGASPFNFGGLVLPTPPVLPCDPSQSTPPVPGSFTVTIGPPSPGSFMYVPPPGSKTYLCGPPLIPGQWAIGSYTPMVTTCDVCLGPKCYTPVVGIGVMNAAPGHATSGCTAPSAPSSPQKSGTPSQCGSLPKGGTAAQVVAAEKSVRSGLAACGIKIGSSKTGGAPCKPGETEISGGCTSVSGLQCGAVDELCELAKKCGGFTIFGGTGGGHHAAKPGYAVDVIGLNASCLKNNFVKDGACFYKDTRTGTTIRDEAACPIDGKTTGPHLHICIGGGSCK